MLQLTDEQLKSLQAIQLDMLLEIRRICEKHQIKYSLIGGTLLGALRHSGYIPWDDDADVGMLRAEYERFRQVCPEELDREILECAELSAALDERMGRLQRNLTAYIALQE